MPAAPAGHAKVFPSDFLLHLKSLLQSASARSSIVLLCTPFPEQDAAAADQGCQPEQHSTTDT